MAIAATSDRCAGESVADLRGRTPSRAAPAARSTSGARRRSAGSSSSGSGPCGSAHSGRAEPDRAAAATRRRRAPAPRGRSPPAPGRPGSAPAPAAAGADGSSSYSACGRVDPAAGRQQPFAQVVLDRRGGHPAALAQFRQSHRRPCAPPWRVPLSKHRLDSAAIQSGSERGTSCSRSRSRAHHRRRRGRGGRLPHRDAHQPLLGGAQLAAGARGDAAHAAGAVRRTRSRGLLATVLLTASPRTYYVVQYWESKEKLYAYARAPDKFHRLAWAAMNRRSAREGRGSTWGSGTRRTSCRRGRTSRSTRDMPAFGLGGGARAVLPVERGGRRRGGRSSVRGDAAERACASGRLGRLRCSRSPGPRGSAAPCGRRCAQAPSTATRGLPRR